MAAASNSQSEPAGLENHNNRSDETIRDINGNSGASNQANGSEATPAAPAEAGKPHGIGAVLAKLGLGPPMLIPMFKGSLAPIIGLAMLQSDPVADHFRTLGYIIPILSVLGLAMLPRGKFIQNLVLDVLSVSIGAAIALLGLWSAVQARDHTTPPGTSLIDPHTGSVRYSSSQAAVCAIWLFASTWISNVIRAKFPSLNVPVIAFSIVISVAMTYSTRFQTMAFVRTFVEELYVGVLVGMALAAGVSFFCIPISDRMVTFGEFRGALGLLRRAVGMQKKYMGSLEDVSSFNDVPNVANVESTKPLPKGSKE